MTVIGSDIILYHTVAIDGSLTYLVSQAMAYLLYPFLGWLADVYFTRYKFIIFSVIAMIVATVLMIVAAVLLIVFSEVRALFALVGVSMIVGLIGMGSFESTVIQFGMDQMLEASSDQLSTFIQWYNWSCNIGQVISVYISAGVLEYFSQCTMVLNTHNPEKIRSTIHPYYFLIAFTVVLVMASVQLICACIGLYVMVYYKKHFNIDRTGEHPLKLIYQVLKYARKHKCPENRSAFTYWEEDIPPRIDLGKSKYGGPFTTEEVEDTKTFFSIFLLLLSMIGFHLSGHGYSILKQLMNDQCPSHWFTVIVADPLHIIFLTTVIGVPIYRLIRRCCAKYDPSMLTKMGLGIFCCLVKEATSMMIQMTMTEGNRCNHFDNNSIDSCFFLTCKFNAFNVCTTISNVTNGYFSCTLDDTPFLLTFIPSILQGFSYLLVFMTALEFICAQAPLRLKGLLIGVWYALLATNYLFVEVPELFTKNKLTWVVYHGCKVFLIFLSLLVYMCISKRYHYRLRDEVVNEQFLVEEIYERELNQAKNDEQESDDDTIHITANSTSYGTVHSLLY